MVARPCVVGRDVEARESVMQLGRQQAEDPFAVGGNDDKPLVAEYGGSDPDEARFHFIEHIGPVGLSVRPGQLYCLLWCPFGQEDRLCHLNRAATSGRLRRLLLFFSGE